VPNVLQQPSPGVFDSTEKLVSSNTGWGTGPNPAQITRVGNSVGAFALPSGGSDSAEIVNLAPGAYTMQVSGVNNTTGVAVAEIYEVP
jgi:hypothetical protein